MAGVSVQIVGSDNVVEAYVARQLPNWSCWQGRAMNVSYNGGDLKEGAELLSEWLSKLTPYSKAVYTLKFHEDIYTDNPIRSNTPDLGGFNFKLSAEESLEYRMPAIGAVPQMDSRLTAIEKTLKELKEGDTGEEKLSGIERILEHPLAIVFVSKLLGVNPNAVTTGAIAGVADQDDPIDYLRMIDPDFDLHMAQLAKIAKNNPAQFKMLISMLENF